MFPDNGGYWRHEGWGEPAAFNDFVHLVYAQHGTGADQATSITSALLTVVSPLARRSS